MFTDEDGCVLGWKAGLVLMNLLRDPLKLVSLVNEAYKNISPEEKKAAMKLLSRTLRVLRKEVENQA